MKPLFLALIAILCGCQKTEKIEVRVPPGFSGLINVKEDRTMNERSLIIVDEEGFGRIRNEKQTRNWTNYTVYSGDRIIPQGETIEGRDFGFFLIGGDDSLTYYFIGSYRDRIALEKDSPQSLKIKKKTPNKAVEPTTMRVTDPANAGSAPRMVAAHF